MKTGFRYSGRRVSAILVAAALFVSAAVAQYPGQNPPRIPPPGVPETEEPPRADPNAVPKYVPPVPRPLSPYERARWRRRPKRAIRPRPLSRSACRAPATVAVGSTDVKITIAAENVSQASAFHVRVAYPKPANADISQTEPPADKESTATVLKWHFDELKAGEKKVIAVTFTPKDNEDIKHVARVSFEHGEQVIVKQNRPDIQTQRIAPTHWHEGEAVTVKLIVENKGKAEAKDIVIVDTLEPGLEHDTKSPIKDKRSFPIQSLKPGEKHEETYTIFAASRARWSAP